jgi:AAA domain
LVKLISLYANNFKKLKFDSPLKFKDGITVISGLNEAGKSTILDALLYALYGKVMRPPGHVKDEDLQGMAQTRLPSGSSFPPMESPTKLSERFAGTAPTPHSSMSCFRVTARGLSRGRVVR